MVGTPNAGSVDAVSNLVDGRKFAPLFGKLIHHLIINDAAHSAIVGSLK